MGILKALGVNADVAAETEQARKEIEWLVECAMASIMGNLTNENGLIPYTVNTLTTFIGKDGPVDKLIDRTLEKTDAFVNKQLKKVRIG